MGGCFICMNSADTLWSTVGITHTHTHIFHQQGDNMTQLHPYNMCNMVIENMHNVYRYLLGRILAAKWFKMLIV